MRYAALSVTGKRQANEDSIFIPFDKNQVQTAIVADGMGGHKAGSLASSMAVEAIVNYLNNGESCDEQALKTAVCKAGFAVYDHAKRNVECRGMGTTAVAVLLTSGDYVAANIGDSRLYHLADGQIKQITRDHSYVEELVRMGHITREQAAVHPNRNIITKALGTTPDEVPDMFRHKWKRGDMLLLCSDGFHGSVSPEETTRILKEETNLNEACEALVKNALYGGSTDNISVVLVLNEED